jgi:hypothetical protein
MVSSGTCAADFWFYSCMQAHSRQKKSDQSLVFTTDFPRGASFSPMGDVDISRGSKTTSVSPLINTQLELGE